MDKDLIGTKRVAGARGRIMITHTEGCAFLRIE